MSCLRAGRIIGVALSLALSWSATALAHTLPGSTLVFSRDSTVLKLELSLPVEDLLIAEPLLAPLGELEPSAAISASISGQVANYFSEYLRVSGVESGALQLHSVTLSRAENEHVGVYTVLEADFASPIREDAGVDLRVQYTAVMHEVRNHRAAVYWREAGAAPLHVATIGYSNTDGVLIPAGGGR